MASSSAVDLIQQAGSAVYAARTKLAEQAQSQIETLQTSMAADPFSLGTDSSFEQLKALSRMAKELETIDLQLREIHGAVSSLTNASGATIAAPVRNSLLLAAPKQGRPRGRRPMKASVDQNKLEALPPASDTVIDLVPGAVAPPAPFADKPKRGRKPKADKAQAMPKLKKAPKTPKTAKAPRAPGALKGNNAALLEHLKGLLNPDTFTAVRQTEAASAVGIPLGSMTYSFNQLVQRGLIQKDEEGQFKLA